MKEQQVFILFGEGVETNAKELNALLSNGWRVVQMCPMPSSVSVTGGSGITTRFFEPQCAVIIEKE